jgi:hypothetical protein
MLQTVYYSRLYKTFSPEDALDEQHFFFARDLLRAEVDLVILRPFGQCQPASVLS